MLKLMIVVIAVMVLLIDKIYMQNYCATTLCSAGVKHIGCQNTGVSPKNCTDPRLIPLNQTYINNILKVHNNYRRQMANGTIKGFAQAARMPQIIWNAELAKLAQLSVRTCVAGDRCRNTVKFKYVGQNSLSTSGYPFWMAREFTNNGMEWENFLRGWFDESKSAKQIDLDVLKVRPTNLPIITHFTIMVNDKVTELGCAALMYDFNYYTFSMVLVCNYNYANIVGKPTYAKGTKCSKCTKGCSKIYPGLCNVGEIVA